jgi:two-component system, NarL family, response regulator DegU
MDSYYKNTARRQSKVAIFAPFNLDSDCLKVVIESDPKLSVIDTAVTSSELLEKVSRNKPDVVLIHVPDEEGKNIDLISDLFKLLPQIKVVILSSPNSLLDQPAALKLGVTGIVGTGQNVKVLIRAIRQVSEGEIWLNQKLIAELLDGNFYGNNDKSKNRRFYRANDLTNRELEVVEMVCQGMNNKIISSQLNISTATVRHHLGSIYGKLNIDDRVNLAIYAFRQKIVQPTVDHGHSDPVRLSA